MQFLKIFFKKRVSNAGRCGLNKFSLQIIAGVKEGEEEALNIAEVVWISRLATMDGQGGINSKDEKKKI